MGSEGRRIAYLYSRYPVVSQTFCDSEMLALEGAGFRIEIGSLNPPRTSFRHERLAMLQADIHYPPPAAVLKARERLAGERGGPGWEALTALRRDHETHYGMEFKSEIRARNGVYFAELFQRENVEHVHVHFANRATHTALFIKKYAGLPFSFTAHAQDFMVDLGSDDLLRELCAEAEFVVAVSDYSADLLRKLCPDSADRIVRIYNGIDSRAFSGRARRRREGDPLRILSVGRLIEFKGFQHLLGACARLKECGIAFECVIAGEGPWEEQLRARAQDLGIAAAVRFGGVMSQEQIARELAAADVFVLACVVDGKGASDILPTVISEAMAAAVPVVSTTIAGVPELVDHGTTGLLAPPGDEQALADALRTLAGDEDLRLRLGVSGREKMETVFALRTTSAQLIGQFDKALRGGERLPASTPAIACLVDEFPAGTGVDDEVVHLCRPEMRGHWSVIAARAPDRIDWESCNSGIKNALPWVEYLPDGIVLEALWKQDPAAETELETLRLELGGAISGECYFREARRAVYLTSVFAKRGIRAVYASRSSTALCAWLIGRLTGIPFGLAVEGDPEFKPAALERICRGARLATIGCAAMGEDLRRQYPDALRLENANPHLRLGPLKMKLPARRLGDAEQEALYRSWFQKLAQACDATLETNQEMGRGLAAQP